MSSEGETSIRSLISAINNNMKIFLDSRICREIGLTLAVRDPALYEALIHSYHSHLAFQSISGIV